MKTNDDNSKKNSKVDSLKILLKAVESKLSCNLIIGLKTTTMIMFETLGKKWRKYPPAYIVYKMNKSNYEYLLYKSFKSYLFNFFLYLRKKPFFGYELNFD